MNDFCTAAEAVEETRKGRLLVVADTSRRENEADFFVAADAATSAHVATMIKRGGGLVCVAITGEQARRLALPLMVPRGENGEKTRVNLTVSVDAARGITSGVSAFDRAKTIRILASAASSAVDLVRPGHVFGLVARLGGLVERQGHTEAAVDLARLAGRAPAGVLCEIVGESGRMAKRDEVIGLARSLGAKVVTVRDLARHVRARPLPPLAPAGVARVSEAALPTRFGDWRIVAYRSLEDGREHVALVLGSPTRAEKPLVRLHSKCLTGDALFSLRCDCGEQLEGSMRAISEAGAGVVIYLDQEGRGIGLVNKIRAYALQDEGHDTVEANLLLGLPVDARTYEAAADILADLGVKEVRLLTNNPDKEKRLARLGVKIAARVPLAMRPNGVNDFYLRTKRRTLGHRPDL